MNPHILRIAKRVDVATAFERSLHTFRIVTDIRPIFDEEPETGIQAATVTHNIQMTYVQDNEYKVFYFGADDKNLKQVLKQARRALAKSRAAGELVNKAGARILNDPEESDERN